MNTISYKELNEWYLNNRMAKENAREYFEGTQPNIFQTGFYKSPSWNWGYKIGIVGVNDNGNVKWFEVVTQFGIVKAAKQIYLSLLAKKAKDE